MGSYAAKRSQPRCTENNEDHFEMARMEDWERELHQELNTSYDGKLIWRMENYKAHRREAIDQNIIYQTSFPCYTHRFGYKYCLRAHLHGLDGHLTISLVQMSTRFDNALACPSTTGSESHLSASEITTKTKYVRLMEMRYRDLTKR